MLLRTRRSRTCRPSRQHPRPSRWHPRAPAEPDPAAEIQKYAALKGQGLITEEEFAAKKKQILGI